MATVTKVCRNNTVEWHNNILSLDCVGSVASPTALKPIAACPVCSEPLTIDLSSTNEDLSNEEPRESTYISSISVNTSVTGKGRGGLNILSGNKKNILDKIDLNVFQSSSKMEALMRVRLTISWHRYEQLLSNTRQELYIMDNSEHGCKAIVFSQFVNMLDLLEYRITLGWWYYLMLHGLMCIVNVMVRLWRWFEVCQTAWIHDNWPTR